jgi:hypothetical protein
MNSLRFVAVATAVVLPVVAHAGDLFAITLDGDLMKLDITTGTHDLVGSTGIEGVGGLEFYGNKLYAFSLPGTNPASLFIIDPDTGVAENVGPLGVDISYEGGLAFSDSGDAYLIAGRDELQDSGVFWVDLDTGAAEEVGSFEVPDANGLAVRDDGMFVSWSQFQPGIFTVDPQDYSIGVLKNFGPLFNLEVAGGMVQLDDRRVLTLSNQIVISGTPNDARLLEFDIDTGEYIDGWFFEGTLSMTGLAWREGCSADLTGDGETNFFDVSAFLIAYNTGDPAADFNDDGDFNFLDVSAFIGAYQDGCP